MLNAYLPPRATGAPVHHHAAKQLFGEALTTYLQAMRANNMLTPNDKHLLLLAVHGLTRLNHYPLARALIRVAFAELTAQETLDWIDRAHRAQHETDYPLPPF